MNAKPVPEFDLGPLTWVKTEIDHSLGQARENLDRLAAAADDRTPVKYILTHLHQATGALAMVGLGAATRFNEELERLVASMETVPAAELAERAGIAKKAISNLSDYLDALIGGQPDRPMALLPAYLELNRARGLGDATEGDLFHPDLTVTPPVFASRAAAMDDTVLAKALAHQRILYQQGLLRVLRGTDQPEALRVMQEAVSAVESLQASTPNRAFWTAAAAFFDALAFGGLTPDAAIKPLFAKVDQQIKQLIDGAGKVPERLFRDLLLQVGLGRTVTERIGALKEAYHLDRLLARPNRAHGESGDEALGSLLRELRDMTAQQKDTWLKYTSGNRAALEPFGKQALALADRAGRLPDRDIQNVYVRLTDAAPILKARSIPPSETQALEVATALLFIESSLENYFKLGADFSHQARAVTERLKAAMQGESVPPMDSAEGGLLDEMTRRAQEKLLVFQVGQEVQVNLQNIEHVLDTFFRDPAKRPDLKALPPQFAQVQGALVIMELDAAAALNAAVMARVQQFAEGALDGTGEAAELVADGLSALGLYITALQQGASRPTDVLAPALVRYGLAEREHLAPDLPLRTGTVSPLDIDVAKQKVHALYEDWREQPVGDAREKLERAVDELMRDAHVLSDAAVARQSEEALAAIQQSADPLQTGVLRALQELAPDKAPETPAPKVVQLVDAPGAEIDRELLAIFLEEASEVVRTIAENLAICRGAPHDRDALTVIRRGFHTLKGSGRMVGLAELGEVAWQCEQVMNKWLKDDRPATPGLLDFVGLAERSFEGWVGSLKARIDTAIDGGEIARRAELLKSGEEPVRAPEPQLEPLVPVEAASPALEAFEPAPTEEPAVAEPAHVPEELEIAALAAAPAAGQPELQEPVEEPDVVIGSAVLSSALFAIYLGEAEQHLATLEQEMAAIESDPMHPVSHEFMRAAHTLASSSRTTGFDVVANVAHALEQWLAEAIDFPPEFTLQRLEVTRRAVDALGAMISSVAARALPFPREDVIGQLRSLRERLRESRRTGEGRLLRVPTSVREDLEAAQDADTASSKADEALPVDLAEPPPVAEPPPGPARAPEPAAEETLAALVPAIVFEGGKDQRKIRDDVDRDLLPIFLEEAREILPAVGEGLRHWRAGPTDHSPAADLRRHLHTLKGGARMTGLMRLGELAHQLEARIVAMDASQAPLDSEFEEAEEKIDRFSSALERLGRGETAPEVAAVEVPAGAVFEQQKDKPAALAVIAAAAEEVASREALPPELRETRSALLRVNADLVDDFVNEAGELSIARSRIEGEIIAFRRALADLSDNVSRMRSQLREIEIASEGQMQSRLKEQEEHGSAFDPLEFDRFTRMQELTRFLAESLGDVITLQQGLQKNLDETELALLQQARMNRELQQGLMGVRLVPLATLADRFFRIVRQTAKELDKKANLELKGVRVELDRSVLEKITAPFEHLLRNAVAHGLESPRERLAAGKPEIGEIVIDAAQRGNEVVLTIADDGAGLNFERIRRRALEAGLLAPGVELPEAQLAQFIFLPGFSTADEVTQVAGRGVGMDVVKNEIVSLGGRIELSSTPGRGATFTISLPLTLAVTQAVMLRAGQHLYAVPSVTVDQVQEYKSDAYAGIVAAGEIVWKDNRYPLRSLPALLGQADTLPPARQIPVMLLRSGVQRAAVRVDEIVGNSEIVVKTIGPQLARLAGIAGATVLGNGQVVLMLNPVSLVHRELAAGVVVTQGQRVPQAPPAVVKPVSPLVMVVDDSLTVRKISGRMLSREGYEVVTAKDGVEALQQLQDLRPDVILLDVEMPRMDGFEFARNVRADAATKSIPIIMITSRTAEKHRNRALEVGVNEYMGKPYQEEQLLELVRRYARVRSHA